MKKMKGRRCQIEGRECREIERKRRCYQKIGRKIVLRIGRGGRKKRKSKEYEIAMQYEEERLIENIREE